MPHNHDIQKGRPVLFLALTIADPYHSPLSPPTPACKVCTPQLRGPFPASLSLFLDHLDMNYAFGTHSPNQPKTANMHPLCHSQLSLSSQPVVAHMTALQGET